MGTILKYGLIGGFSYGLHRASTAIAGAMGVCFGVVLLICVLGLIGGLVNWEYYDVTIRNLLALIGGVYALSMIGMLMSGQFGIALVQVVVLLLVVPTCQPTVTALLNRWDTPERRLERSLEIGCSQWGVGEDDRTADGYRNVYTIYVYSKVDGYCHFNHQEHEDLWKGQSYQHPSYTETAVPVDTVHSDVFDVHAENEYVRGALENIERLKAAAIHKTAATPAHHTHSMMDDLKNPWGWLFFLVCFVVQYIMWWREQNAREAAPKPDPHAWLAEGRKAAGLD